MTEFDDWPGIGCEAGPQPRGPFSLILAYYDAQFRKPPIMLATYAPEGLRQGDLTNKSNTCRCSNDSGSGQTKLIVVALSQQFETLQRRIANGGKDLRRLKL